MKKTIIISLLSVLIVIVDGIGLTACGKNPARLDAPCNFIFNNRMVSWDKVENAEGYVVFFEGKEYEVSDNGFNTLTVATEAKKYTIEVMAIGDGKKYSDSEWSVFDFEITEPYELFGDTINGFIYTLLEDKSGYEVSCGFNDLVGVITIPEYFCGLPVTKVANCGFSPSADTTADPFTGENCNTTITGVILPSTLTCIGSGAFECCVNLTEVVIPDSVTTISAKAFQGCIRLKKVTLPKNLKVISDWCFSNCALQEVVLPENLEKIEDCAFCCETKDGKKDKDIIIKHTEQNFTEIVIPNSVTHIGDKAFYGCQKLKDVTMPDNIESFGFSVFDDTAWYDSKPDGLVTTGNVLYGFKGELKQNVFTVPSNINVIAGRAFNECANLKKVVILENVRFIGERAFSLTEIEEVSFSYGLKSIKATAFLGCNNLESVILPDSLTEIDTTAFGSNANLKWIVLPKSLESIDEKSFYNSNALTSVYYTGNLVEWEALLSRNGVEKSVLCPYATVYYYSETKPSSEGDYWHYVDGEVTKW